ncbi:MAG: transposase [Gaiellaceae bacterium]
MGRVQRTSLPDGYFHVVSRGVAAGGPIFVDDDDRDVFVQLVRRVTRRHRWTCHAFCLMGSHYHLVVDSRCASLSSGIHRLNWLYARYFNGRRGRFGHVFAERFSTRVIESEQYLHEACAYVLLNPVKAGLCDRVEDWPWSYSRLGLDVT